jgi:hypothetical protein
MIKNISENLSKVLAESQLIKGKNGGVLENEDTERIFYRDSNLVAKNLMPEVRVKYLKKESKRTAVPILLLQKSQSRYIKRGPSEEMSPRKAGLSKLTRAASNVNLPSVTDRDKDPHKLDTQVDFFEKKFLPPVKKEKACDMQNMTLVVTNSRKLVVQPKFFEENGTMCVSELWSDKERARIGHQKKDQILDVNQLPVLPDDKLYLSIYRPSKMEKESREKKQLIKKHLISITDQLMIDTHLLMRRNENKNQNDAKKKKKGGASPLKRVGNVTKSYTQRDQLARSKSVKYRESETNLFSENAENSDSIKLDQIFSNEYKQNEFSTQYAKGGPFFKDAFSDNSETHFTTSAGLFLRSMETDRGDGLSEVPEITRYNFLHRSQSIGSVASDTDN